MRIVDTKISGSCGLLHCFGLLNYMILLVIVCQNMRMYKYFFVGHLR